MDRIWTLEYLLARLQTARNVPEAARKILVDTIDENAIDVSGTPDGIADEIVMDLHEAGYRIVACTARAPGA